MYIEEPKHLNYKRVILVVAIIVFVISCIYIGLILPRLVNIDKKNKQQITQEQQVSEDNIRDNSNIIKVDLTPDAEPPAREEEETESILINEQGIEKIKNIYHSDYKRVFLTFDDGPSKTVTPQILSILEQYNIKATFFVLGSRVELYPDIVKDAYNKGHYIANHGYSHKYDYIYASTDNIIEEYRHTENIIRDALQMPNYYTNVFRFPGGSSGGKYNEVKQSAIQILKSNNIAYLDWNCLTKDSEGKFTKEELVQNLINTSQNKNSIVVLMHDAGNKKTTYEALPEIIEYFINNGYVFENLYNILGGQ